MEPLPLEELTVAHRMRGLVTSLVADAGLSEDALQTAWVRLLETPASRRPRHLAPWLWITARRANWNESRNDRRRQERERVHAKPEAIPSSEEIAERTEVSYRVIAAIDRMEPIHGNILRDHYLGELSIQDLSTRDGLSAEAIRSRIRRARTLLREHLEAEGLGRDLHWSIAAAPLLSSPSLTSGATALLPSTSASAAAGLLIMKKLLVSLVLIAAGLLAVRQFHGSTSTVPPAGPNHPIGAAPPAAMWPNGLPDRAGVSPDIADAAREALGEPPAAPMDAIPYQVLSGRIVDADADPIGGAMVRVTSMDPWSGAGRSVLDHRSAGMRWGLVAESLRDGSFTLRLPLPIPAWTKLTVDAGRHRTTLQRLVGPGSTGTQPAPGDSKDLGTIQLGPAASIQGIVAARDGTPIAGAAMSIQSEEFGSIGEPAVSDADGRYVLGHNPAGRFEVRARADGWLDAVVSGVEARNGEDTLGVDLILDASPFCITGVVVDQDGTPITGQQVWAWPQVTEGSSSPTACETDLEGRFKVWVARALPHDLQISKRGYEQTGKQDRARVRVKPGDDPITVMLRRMKTFDVVVVDAASGEAIEHFGVRVLKDNGIDAKPRYRTERRPAKATKHPGGKVAVAVRIGVDKVFITARGYRPFLRDFFLDEGSDTTCTVRLERSPIISGRVTRNGAPVGGAAVLLERGKCRSVSGEGRFEQASVFEPNRNERADAHTGPDGCFRIPSLGRGIIRLTVNGDGGEVTVALDRIGDADHGIGDLELGPYGEIHGQVLVPEGQDATGLQVWLDHWFMEPKAVTGTDGRFRLGAVPPGRHRLILRGRDPELESMTGPEFLVPAGATVRTELDARGLGRAELALTVTLNGQPATGIKVDVAEAPILRGVLGSFGACDAGGRVSAYRPTGASLLVAILLEGDELYHPEITVEAEAGQVREYAIAFHTASATLRLPSDAQWPRNGTVRLEAAQADGDKVLQTRTVRFRNGLPMHLERAKARIGASTLTFGNLVAGSQRLRLTIMDTDQPGSTKRVGTAMVTTKGPNDRTLGATAVLQPGPENEVTLKEEE